jgi:hypothetical protein
VTGVEPDRVTVAFADAGYRTIAAAAADEGLLAAEPPAEPSADDAGLPATGS